MVKVCEMHGDMYHRHKQVVLDTIGGLYHFQCQQCDSYILDTSRTCPVCSSRTFARHTSAEFSLE